MVPGPADLLEHPEIELVEEPGLSKDRNKLCGLQESVDRISPAGQDLGSRDLAGEDPDHGLVADPDPALLDRLVDMGGKVASHRPA